MYFREYYAKQAQLRSLPHYHKRYHEHFPSFESKQESSFTGKLLLWLGEQLESWGQGLQKRYRSAPRLTQ